VGLAVERLARMAHGCRHRQTGDGSLVAPSRLPALLDLEKPMPVRTTCDPSGCPPPDSHDVADDPLWGAPRIHGELLKLGIDVSQATVARYMARHRSPSQTWRTFLANHVDQIAAADFLVVPTVTYRLLFVLAIMAHRRRHVVHVGVTAHPTAAWTAQQLREAFPEDTAPRYLVHDRDHTFAAVAATAGCMGIQELRTAARSPWQNAYAERLNGSIRRECLDHVIVVNETGLSRILTRYLAYYHLSRTHLSLAKDSPHPRPVAPRTRGPIVAIPLVGGLHYRYDRRAA
jgi:putative transposase